MHELRFPCRVLPQSTVGGLSSSPSDKSTCSRFEATTIGEVKFTPKGFQSNALQYFYQQLMAEAPF